MDKITIFNEGAKKWNDYRKDNPDFIPSFENMAFIVFAEYKKTYITNPVFENINFSNCNMTRANFDYCKFINCNFDNSEILFADFTEAYFDSCTFNNSNLCFSNMNCSIMKNCVFKNANLSHMKTLKTDFSSSVFINCDLEHVMLIKDNLNGAIIKDSKIYGLKTWNSELKTVFKANLNIVKNEKRKIIVDNISIGDVLYQILSNNLINNLIIDMKMDIATVLTSYDDSNINTLEKLQNQLRKNLTQTVIFNFQELSEKYLKAMKDTIKFSKYIVIDISAFKNFKEEIIKLIEINGDIDFYLVEPKNSIKNQDFIELLNINNVKTIQQYSTQGLPNGISELNF